MYNNRLLNDVASSTEAEPLFRRRSVPPGLISRVYHKCSIAVERVRPENGTQNTQMLLVGGTTLSEAAGHKKRAPHCTPQPGPTLSRQVKRGRRRPLLRQVQAT
jgi:hypothetical protein